MTSETIWLSKRELKNYLSVKTTKTIDVLVGKGALPPPYRLSKRLHRWSAAEVDDFIRNGKEEKEKSLHQKPEKESEG